MQTRQQPTGGVRVKRIVVIGGGALALLVVGALVYLAGSVQFTLGFPSRSATDTASPQPTIEREPEVISRRQRDYSQKPAPVKEAPAPAPAVEEPTVVAAGLTPFGLGSSTPSTPPAVPPPPPALTTTPTSVQETPPAPKQSAPPTGRAITGRTTRPAPGLPLAQGTASAKKAWRMSESSTAVGKSPFDTDNEATTKEKEAKLIEEAQWVRAADITKVLYRNQMIPIMTLGAVNSDIPESDVTLLVTRNVYDRWMTKVLIPHNTRLIAKTSSAKIEPGQEGLPMSIEEGQYPDGTILNFKQAKVHDRSGQAGLRGEVDTHLMENLAYAGIAALLNIGVRGAAGSPSGYQENLPQQYAAQVGQSVTNSATRIMEQRVPRQPTIREKAGAEGFVSLQVNIDLSTVPVTKR